MASAPLPGERVERPPLARPRDCVVGGVSVALADHLGWPVAAVRWILVGTTLLGGAGVLFYLWLWALTHATPTRVTVFLALSPITASLLGALLLGEQLGLGTLVGVAGVLAGLWLTTRRSARPQVA